MKQAVVRQYEAAYGEKPRYVIRSPGRVNLIGEHTDYNDGFVLPLAIGHAVWFALSPSPDGLVTVHAHDFNETAKFSLDTLENTGAGWLEYIRGVAFGLKRAGYEPSGWKGCIMSDLPMGAGLSSSAALETGAVSAFAAVSGLTVSPRDAALIAQQAENDWVGMNCGIMDQMASACGMADHALLIDCKSLEHEPVPLPGDCIVAILDTTTRRKLVESEYNNRRSQCDAASRFFGVASLRELTLEQLLESPNLPDPITYNRALHVVSENRRVQSCVEFLKQGRFKAVGRMMVGSHESLRNKYEVSSTALDRIVEAALESEGCYGARMTGGGFAGCAVALVQKDARDRFTEEVIRGYHARSGLTATVYTTSAANGTEVIEAP